MATLARKIRPNHRNGGGEAAENDPGGVTLSGPQSAHPRAQNPTNDDDISCSEPSQWWGEAPEKTIAEKRSLTHYYKLDDTASECEPNQSLEIESSPPSKCEPCFPDVPIEIWGGLLGPGVIQTVDSSRTSVHIGSTRSHYDPQAHVQAPRELRA